MRSYGTQKQWTTHDLFPTELYSFRFKLYSFRFKLYSFKFKLYSFKFKLYKDKLKQKRTLIKNILLLLIYKRMKSRLTIGNTCSLPVIL